MSDLRFPFASKRKGSSRFLEAYRVEYCCVVETMRPIKVFIRFLMTINFSLNVMSPTSHSNATVAIGASNCPLATINWNSDGGPSFKIVCGASDRFLRKSASRMAIDRVPVSMRRSIYNSPKSIGKYGILR